MKLGKILSSVLPQASPVGREGCRLSKYLMAESTFRQEGAKGKNVRPDREEAKRRMKGIKRDEGIRGLGKGPCITTLGA